jgi:acetyl-CoA C-acetyltransferase
VVPVKDINGLTILDRDEHMRPGTDMQALASLNASFGMMAEMGGFGPSAIQAHPEIESDQPCPPCRQFVGHRRRRRPGAARLQARRQDHGSEPRARIKAFANIGSDPALMLTGPVDVTEKLLKRAKMKIEDIDLFELNEAFASVVLRFQQAFDIPSDKINVNGGAIAMGHPLGATGAMILGTVLDELERRDLNTALVTLCIGAGMGTATIIERV